MTGASESSAGGAVHTETLLSGVALLSRKLDSEAWKTLDLKSLCEQRDAGRYAEMLLRLSLPETREAWIDIYTGDLAKAASHRQSARTRSAAAVSRPHGALAEKSDYLQKVRAYTPSLDTHGGRRALIRGIADRAAELSSDTLEDLGEVIIEGREAEQKMIDTSLPLVFFVVKDVAHRRALNRECLYVGYEGLAYAARSYVEPVGAFSSYAVEAIKGYLYKHFATVKAQSMGVSRGVVDRMRRMDKVAGELLQELQREPEVEEIAQRLGWRPATIRRYQQYGQVPLSLDAPISTDDDRERYEVVALQSGDDGLAAVEADPDEANPLHDALQNAFATAGMTSQEQTVLEWTAEYGSDDGGRPEHRVLTELATLLTVEEYEVRNIFNRACRKMLHSPEAVSLLTLWLRKTQ